MNSRDIQCLRDFILSSLDRDQFSAFVESLRQVDEDRAREAEEYESCAGVAPDEEDSIFYYDNIRG